LFLWFRIRSRNKVHIHIAINKGERVATFQLWEDEPQSHDTSPHLHELTTPHPHTPFDPDIDWDQSEVSDAQKDQLRALTREFSDCFVHMSNKKFGLTDKTSCTIETFPNTKPFYKLPYRTSPIMREEMDKIFQQQIEQGLIEPAEEGAWASLALLVEKASRGYRMVIDYRVLNAVTIPKMLRIPRLDEVLDCVGETKPQFFSVLDCTQGFH
jgi:hypothetical protein